MCTIVVKVDKGELEGFLLLAISIYNVTVGQCHILELQTSQACITYSPSRRRAWALWSPLPFPATFAASFDNTTVAVVAARLSGVHAISMGRDIRTHEQQRWSPIVQGIMCMAAVVTLEVKKA